MTFTEVNKIIDKKNLGLATDQEIGLLMSWVNESEENENHYFFQNEIFEATAQYQPKLDFNSNAAFEKHLALLNENVVEEDAGMEDSNVIKLNLPTTKTKIFNFRKMASIAAMFVLGLCAAMFFNTKQNIITSGDSVQFVSLEDGSDIWLDKNSTLSYKDGFGTEHRNIKLDGKAFFDVERNENIAFNINTNNLDVSVLGTSFTIDAINTTPSVSVKSGKVKVVAGDESKILLKNDKITFAENKLISSEVALDDISWRNPNLQFQDASLEHVVTDINLYFDSKLIIKNPENAASCLLSSGGLKNESLENIIEVLRSNFNIKVEKNEDNGMHDITVLNCN